MFAVVLLALTAWFVYLLGAPFRHPNAHFAYLTTFNDGWDLQRAPEYSLEQYAAFLPLSEATFQSSEGAPELALLPLSRPTIAGLPSTLTPSSLDAVLLYVNGRGIIRDDQPRWPDASGAANLLSKFRQVDAQTKLLLVDLHDSGDASPLTAGNQDFPTELRRAVEATGDKHLWVLVSRSSFERDHLSRALRQSVFGAFVARGLRGHADANRDQMVTVGELAQYVNQSVAAWVRHVSAGAASQSPQLFWGAASQRIGHLSSWQQAPLISVSNVPAEERELKIEDNIASANAQRSLVREGLNEQFKYQSKRYTAKWRSGVDAAQMNYGTRIDSVRSIAGRGAASPAADAGAGKAGEAPGADEAGGAVAAAGAGGKAGAGGAAGAGGTAGASAEEDAFSFVDPLDDPELVAMLAEGWALRDALLNVKTQLRPVDFAPDLWRAFELKLLQVEQKIRGGLTFELKPLRDALKYEILGVKRLLVDDPAIELAADSIPAKLWERRARIGIAAAAPAIPPEVLAAEAPYELFQKWLTANPKALSDDSYLLRLLPLLAGLGPEDWPLTRAALRCRALGEQAAAAVAQRDCGFWRPQSSTSGWQQACLAADRFRLHGERVAHDRIGANWKSLATANLTAASDGYQSILREVELLRQLDRLTGQLVHTFPAYLQWFSIAGADTEYLVPQAGDLEELIEALAAAHRLRAAESIDPAELTASLARLRSLEERLTAGLSPQAISRLTSQASETGASWRLEALLETPLLDAATRIRMLAAMGDLEAAEATRFVEPSTLAGVVERPEPGAVQGRVLAVWRLRRAWLGLAHPHGALEFADTVLAEMDRSLEKLEAAAADAGQLQAPHRELENLVGRYQRELPNAMAAQLSGLAGAGETLRCDRLRSLWRVVKCSCLDPLRSDMAALPGLIDDQRQFEDWRWRHERRKFAIADAVAGEAAGLLAETRRLETQLNSAPSQAAIEATRAAQLGFEGAAAVPFAYASTEQSISLALSNRGASESPVWCVLDYDADLLDVEAHGVTQPYLQQKLPARLSQQIAESQSAYDRLRAAGRGEDKALESAAEVVARTQLAARYPYRPDLAGFPPTVVLASGEIVQLELTVRRKSDSARDARIVVRAINAVAYVRHEIALKLPERDAIRLVAAGPPTTWEAEPGGVTLYPFPHRPATFSLHLANNRETDFEGQLTLLTPALAFAGETPATPLSADGAAAWLRQLGPAAMIGEPVALKLAAGGPPQPLFKKAAAPPPPAPTPAAAGDPPSAEEAAPPPDKPPPIPIRHGVFAVIRDAADGATVIKRIRIVPQRPRRYVQLRVAYDAARERLDVVATPRDQSVVSADGIPLAARIVEPGVGESVKFSGTIVAPAYEAQLHANISSAEERMLTLEVDVDGFPRAFIYRFSCATSQSNIPEHVDRSAIRLDLLADTRVFAAPRKSLTVSLAVDAPVGSFLDPRDVLEVGIDADQDREFRGDEPLQIHSDRQVEILLTPPVGDGNAEVLAEVDDFKLEIPGGGIVNARVNLLARLAIGSRSTWSKPIECAFDGEKPTIGNIRVLSGRRILPDQPLQLSIAASDGNLGGVARVEFGLSKPVVSEFEGSPVQAVQQPAGNWVGKFDAAALAPGKHTLLVRAVDLVDNVGDFQKLSFEVIDPAQVAAAAIRPNAVSGQVIFRGSETEGAQVELVQPNKEDPNGKVVAVRTTDARGRFEIPRVAPGPYTLRSTAVVQNNPRKGEATITVTPGPKRQAPVRVTLQ